MPSSPSPPPHSWTRDWMREYPKSPTPKGKPERPGRVCYYCPSQPGHTPSSSSRITRTRHAAASRQWPQMPSFLAHLGDAQPTHPSSRALQHQQSGANSCLYTVFVHVVMPRVPAPASPTSPLSRVPRQNDITNSPAPNSIPPRICNSHHSQVPSQRPPRTPPAKCQKKGVPQSGINPPPSPLTASISTQPTRPHLAAVPCRSPRTRDPPTSLTSSSSPSSPTHEKSCKHACTHDTEADVPIRLPFFRGGRGR